MTLDEVYARLAAAEARVGGTFKLTVAAGDTYVTHWFRPEPHAFEDCRHVGSGTVGECLDAVDRYATQQGKA